MDEIDSAFNSYMTLNGMKELLDKSKHKIRSDIDVSFYTFLFCCDAVRFHLPSYLYFYFMSFIHQKQISNLQKRVNDNLVVLEKTRSKLNTMSLLEEQNNLLVHQNSANISCSSKSGAYFENVLFLPLSLTGLET